MYLRRDDGVTESGGGLHLESRVYLRRDDGVTESGGLHLESRVYLRRDDGVTESGGGATFRVTCVFEEG